MMNASEFATKALDAARNYRTLYVMGCFGAPLTGSNVTRYCTNHAYNKAAARAAMIKAAGDQDPPVFGFDCVGLIKGILWGWNGGVSKTYGGTSYAANGVPDIGADAMITVCSSVSADFSGIVPGAVVWLSGHIGIYIGDGLAVECSPKWENKVQVTAVANIGEKAGYNARKWTQWGKLPYINYEEVIDLTEAQVRTIARDEWAKMEAERAALPASDWAKPFIQKAVDLGLMAKNEAGSIDRPQAAPTRQELAVVANAIYNKAVK